uniref:Uncharacterized protein n=1 Tax=Brassica oleracea TaxID=3712 RepID=A0A3P6DC50_BRAOL|nr:unnamed protein product [Brassica oleracea]
MLRLHNAHLKNKIRGDIGENLLESNADTNPGAAPFSLVFAKIYWECVITYAPLGGNGESGDDMPGVVSVTSKPRVDY